MGKSEIASVKHILIKEGAKSKITKAKLAAQQKYKLSVIQQCNPNSLRGLGLVPTGTDHHSSRLELNT